MPTPAAESEDHEIYATRLGVSQLFSRAYLMEEVDPEQSTIPLAAYCFMTGYMYVQLLSTSTCWSRVVTDRTNFKVTSFATPPHPCGLGFKLATQLR
jgi:hypothetical protein